MKTMKKDCQDVLKPQNTPNTRKGRYAQDYQSVLKPEGYAPEHNMLRNTQNTQKKGLHVRFQHYEHKEMRCSFRNTRAVPTKSQRICEACEGLHVV